ncbi:MAG: hypothetical protein IJO03_06040 [Clostridia bacterium]|nr:hypothetical protein [Clostridia bacterium]MBQ7121809.1 hypothetical protein [Clostridia bacterium]
MKKLTAIILTVAMLLGAASTSAFALDIGDTVNWHDDGGYHTGSLDGYLTEGVTTLYPIPVEGGEGNWACGYYEFDASKEGCYLISASSGSFDVAESSNGINVYGYAKYAEHGENGRIYYLEEGKNYIQVSADDEGTDINISYHSETADIEMFEAAYYVESIEIANIEKYKVAYEYYFSSFEEGKGGFGCIDACDDGAMVTVNFKDGTKTTFEYCYDYEKDDYNTSVTLPNGKEYHLAIYQSVNFEGEEIYLVASIAEYVFLKEECTIEKVSMGENVDALSEEVSKYSEYLSEHIAWCFEFMFDPEVNDFMYYFEQLFSGSAGLIRIIFNEIALFIGYYLGV